MTAADRTELMRRAWELVNITFREGDYCADCEQCVRTTERLDEPASRDCRVLESSDDQRDCPAVDLDEIADEMDGERCDAEEARREWRDFDCRR